MSRGWLIHWPEGAACSTTCFTASPDNGAARPRRVLISSGSLLGLLWPDRTPPRPRSPSSRSPPRRADPGRQHGDPATRRAVDRSALLRRRELDDISVAALRTELQVNCRGIAGARVQRHDGQRGGRRRGANAIAAAYLEQRTAAAQQRITEASDADLDRRRTRAQPQASRPRIRRRIARGPDPGPDSQRAVLIATSSTPAAHRPAAPPQDTDKPRLYVFVGAGFFLGLFVGAFVALIRDRMSTRTTQRAQGDADPNRHRR